MKKQTKTLIILLAVLVLLAAGFFAVKALTKESEESEPQAAEEYTVLFSAEVSDITEFSYTAEGEKLTFKSTENGWVYADDPDMPIDSEKLSAMVSALSEIKAYKKIDTDEDFGFAENAVEISVKTTSGVYNCTVGNKNDLIDKAYLLTDKSEIYTTDSAMRSEFTDTLEDLLLADAMRAIDPGSITNISVKNAENSFEIAKTDERELYYRFSYILENDLGKTPLDDTKVNSYLAGIAAPYLTCEDYAPTEEELSAAGFDDPAVLTITYTETDEEENETTKNYQLYFGGTYTDEVSAVNRRYVMLEDSDMLFYIMDASAESMIAPVLADIAPTYLAQMSFSEVTKFSFVLDGESHIAVMEEKDGEKICMLDGKELNSAFVESFFLDLTLLTSEGGYYELMPMEDPEISAEFTLKTEKGTDDYRLRIYEHNANFCIAEFSGRQDDMLVSIRDYNKIFDSLEELKENAAR